MAVSFDPKSFSAPFQQTIQQAKDQATQQTWNRVSPETQAAVKQRLQQSSESLRGAKAQLEAQLSEQVSQRGEQVRQSAKGLSETSQSFRDRFGQALGDRLHQAQGWFSQPVQQWLDDHRVIVWATAHPVWTAIALFILALLSLNLLKILLNPKTWGKILALPIRLAKIGLATDEESLYFEQTLSPGDVRQGEVQAILRRLEALNKEQEILHEQLKLLLGQERTKTKL